MSTAGEPPLSARRAARLAVVQALYQMDIAGTDLNDVIGEFLSFRLTPDAEDQTLAHADRQLFADVLRGVLRRQREIDPQIDRQLAEGWRLTRIDSILRAILRAGVWELLERPDIPWRVVITEYLEVAKSFLDDDGPRVVNGILDRLARQIRQDASKKDGP